MQLSGNYPTPSRACLLEYDERFEMLEGFVKYDFNHQPTDLPEDLEGAFDRILWDPPYHSAACMRECESSHCPRFYLLKIKS